MKVTPLLALFVLVTPLAAQKEAAPSADKPVQDKKVELMPNQQAFLNLPEETRKEFIKYLSEASRLFQEKRIFECLEQLDKATKVFPDSPELHNLRGSCFVEMRAFDKALASFESGRVFTKENSSIDFNIAEVHFVTKQWQKSADIFDRILKSLPANNIALARLVEFKLLLCKKKLGLHDEATILAEKYDYLDDSPYYYFAQAAIAYDKNDLVKAEEWLAMAGRIFQGSEALAPWQDTLVEYGYIKSFYGEEADSPVKAP